MQWLDIEANPSPKYKEKTLNTKAISNPEALPIQPKFCIQVTLLQICFTINGTR